MKPGLHKPSGRWRVQYPSKFSTTGKPQAVYFATEEDAQADIESRKKEKDEHGRSQVSAQERQWILFARNQLDGDLSKLPDVLAHWKATGPGSITATTVEDAIKAYKEWRLGRVSKRTASDIRYRLNGFSEAFGGRSLHSIHASEIETYISSFKAAGSAASVWKRLSPLLKFAVRHRMIATNPLEMLERVKAGKVARKVYTPDQFKAMLEWAQANSFWVMLPYLAISGLCFTRTAELVRVYASESVLCWDDFLKKRKLIHIRPEVSKTCERFIPYGDAFERLMHTHLDTKTTGRVIDIFNSDFSDLWKKMHADLNIKPVRNGMRKSCISYKLAAEPELGIVQCARWCGNSEAKIKGFYWSLLSKEDGEKWFDLPVIF